jgi:cell division protein ZapB|tara:strand:- start:58 stop:381 length:324 start_codon:yes stop_codon:yes gene_type:complete
MIPWTALSGHVGVLLHQTTIASPGRPDYIGSMVDNINSTFERELKRLEKRVDALVSVCDQLQDENRSLKQRQDVLTTERAGLLQKNEQVRARVEAMVGRLKAMEQGC